MTRRKIKLIEGIGAFFCGLYLSWRVFFTLPYGAGALAMTAAVILLGAEILGIFDYFISFWILSSPHDFALPEVDPGQEWPDVDVFIATYNESPALLFKTVNGCRHMDYPDPDKVHIWLCDDGRRESVRQLAREQGVGYLTRQDNQGAKAGNLNNALKHTRAPYVVTFDADMIPRRSFLVKTIPYFMDAARKQIPLGFLQTPQAFHNYDLFQFRLHKEESAANEQDFFYREIEPARTNSNSVIYGGSNTVLSRAALDSVGGFYTKAITEDFATGLLMEGSGWVSLAIGEPLATGLSPEDLPSLIQQRVRWGRGVINVLYQVNLFFTRRYSTEQKLSYWTSIVYWLNPFIRAIYLIVPILAGLFRLPVVRCTVGQVLIFWLPYMVVTGWAFRKLTHNIRSSHLTNIYDTIMFPFLILPIFQELIGISLKKFKVTDKDKSQPGQFRVRYVLPFVFLLLLDAAAILVSAHDLVVHDQLGTSITLFWLLYNGFLLIRATTFVIGRDQQMTRMMRQTMVVATAAEDPGVMVAMDEGEFEVVFSKPLALSPGQDLPVQLDMNGGTVQVQAQYLGSREEEGLRVDRFRSLSNDDNGRFMDAVYDRPLPELKRKRHARMKKNK